MKIIKKILVIPSLLEALISEIGLLGERLELLNERLELLYERSEGMAFDLELIADDINRIVRFIPDVKPEKEDLSGIPF